MCPWLLVVIVHSLAANSPDMQWTSENDYRVLLDVDARGRTRSHSPASVEIDFVKALAEAGGRGALDESTLEVIALDAAGRPRVYDKTSAGSDAGLLPWRIERLYGIDAFELTLIDQRSEGDLFAERIAYGQLIRLLCKLTNELRGHAFVHQVATRRHTDLTLMQVRAPGSIRNRDVEIGVIQHDQ